MHALQAANLALRFVLELCALASVAYWGLETGRGATRWVLALGAALLVAVAWGLVVSPKARITLARPLRLLVELVIFALAVAALASTGQWTLAVVFALAVAVSSTVHYVWRSGGAAG